MTRPETTTTSDAGPTATLAPTTAPTAEPAPADDAAPSPTVIEVDSAPVPVSSVTPHQGRYQGGKLYLEGDVPSREVADEFVAKAGEVIGPDNVIDNYEIDPAATEPTDGKVVIDEPLVFPTGSAEIDPAYDSLVQLGVAVMTINPEVTMRVNGYTDDVGDEQVNLMLSIARAQAVVRELSSFGIDPSRFQIAGWGEGLPVADNATETGRQANRRIEIELVGLLG